MDNTETGFTAVNAAASPDSGWRYVWAEARVPLEVIISYSTITGPSLIGFVAQTTAEVTKETW